MAKEPHGTAGASQNTTVAAAESAATRGPGVVNGAPSNPRNKDRHRKGYWTDYGRKRRAKVKEPE